MRFVYLALLGLFVLEGLGVALMGESSTKAAGAAASLRPHLAWPGTARQALLTATPILVAIWALAGLYASLGPTIVRDLTGSRSVVLGGLSLCALALSGAMSALVANSISNRTILFQSTVVLAVGVGLVVLALATRATAAFFVGTVIAGIGFGLGFQGAMRSVLPNVTPHERAGVLSTIYVLSYLSFGLPAVAAGYFVAHGAGVLTTARSYGSIVIVLAVVALFALVVQRSFHYDPKSQWVSRTHGGTTNAPECPGAEDTRQRRSSLMTMQTVRRSRCEVRRLKSSGSGPTWRFHAGVNRFRPCLTTH